MTDAPRMGPPGVADPVAIAQARRDRARLIAAEAEAAVLRGRLAAFYGSRTWRATAPLRALFSVVRPRAAPRPAPPKPPCAGTAAKPCALVIDDHWPQPDRDAGSMEIMTLLDALSGLGYEVIFAADLDHGAPSPARDALVAHGVRCLDAADAPSVAAFIEHGAPALDLCVLCRVFCGGKFLEAVQTHRRSARIVFDSIDLNFLRVQRQAAMDGGEDALEVARVVRLREEAVIAASDATLVVSSVERELLHATMPGTHVVEMPLARAVTPPQAGFASRRGIGFIGGFAHAPNVDAVRWFLAEIWPLVLRDDPEAEFEIVGADMPPGLLDGAPGRVRALGHVPDIGPWFERLRVTVAPLRFGAGAKGKVASSLAAGVPCVATTIAAEGMALRPGEHVLVADTPEEFAARLHDASGDPAVWSRLSEGGLDYAAQSLSKARWQAQLAAMLERIGL